LDGKRDDFVRVEPPIPFLAAGNGPRIRRRAALLDGWHPIAQTPEQIRSGAESLPADARIALRTRLGLGKERRERPLFGSHEEVAADLVSYADAGLTDLIVDHTAETLDDIERDLRELTKLIGDVRG
jgi:alkanesulfonate monooxygenase SsuD/methylene tetrahydromethanopterin reductase-like flavin-dependent oxidoreductase (luciferase family)